MKGDLAIYSPKLAGSCNVCAEPPGVVACFSKIPSSARRQELSEKRTWYEFERPGPWQLLFLNLTPERTKGL